MNSTYPGCLPPSEEYFHTPGSAAKITFFYPVCAGHYYCSPGYRVERGSYDSFLLMFMKSGKGYLTVQDREYSFQEGDLVVLDCYQPHAYGTLKESEFFWLHFDGSASREYYQMILKQNGPVCHMRNHMKTEHYFQRILSFISCYETDSEALCSCLIVELLTATLTDSGHKEKREQNPQVIEDTISYINSHLKEPLPLPELAARVGLSPFYFTRLFKKETGYTPHAYILQSRMNIAKYYLKSSDSSVKEIAFICGFPTESSFCGAFKKYCSMTPSQYRQGG